MLLLLPFVPQAALANFHYCRGTIDVVWVESHGGVQIKGSWASDHTKICNINSSWNGVDKEVCKAWLSQAQIAKASGATVTARYSGSAVNSCSTIPTYSQAPAPQYLMLD